MMTIELGQDGQENNLTPCLNIYRSMYLRSSSNRTSRNAFAIFWIKLKTTLSFHQIGSLFSISRDSESRRQRAADAFDSVRELLIRYFAPKYLGVGHISIDDSKQHNTAYTKVCK